MSQKIVYLDQYVWINLAQAYFGKSQNVDTIKVYEIVRKASESEEVIFPLSINHLIETRNENNPNRRERLIEFMSNISKGYTISPFSCTTDAEIRNAILKRLGFRIINIKDFVVRKGIAHMFGGRPKIIGNIPESVKNEMTEWLDKPEIFKESLKRLVNVNNDSYIHTIKKLEDERSWYASIVKDKNRRKKFVLARNMISVLSPRIIEICNELHISTSIFRNWTEKDILDFIKEIPTFYIPFSLAYSSESDFTKSIIINDILDIFHLATAIPYCDIVLPDRRFAGLAKQQRLDKIYPSSIILSSIRELEECI